LPVWSRDEILWLPPILDSVEVSTLLVEDFRDLGVQHFTVSDDHFGSAKLVVRGNSYAVTSG
jgi:hypothetical protein